MEEKYFFLTFASADTHFVLPTHAAAIRLRSDSIPLRHWRTNFPKVRERPQDFRRQKGDMKQVTSWGSTNTRRGRILFSCVLNLNTPAFTLWLLYSHWRSSSIHWTGGWVVFRVGPGAWEKNRSPLPVVEFVNSCDRKTTTRNRINVMRSRFVRCWPLAVKPDKVRQKVGVRIVRDRLFTTSTSLLRSQVLCNGLHNRNMTIHFISRSRIFCCAMPCWMVNSYRRFGGSYCFCLHGLLIPIDFAPVHALGLCIPPSRDAHIGAINCPVHWDRHFAMIRSFWWTRSLYSFIWSTY
jgi:hypothetical protein